MQYKIPYFHFIIFLFFFSLTDLHSDEECDILCRAGYESESTSEIYENKKNQPQYNSSIEKSLFVENTEQVQKDLNELILFFEEGLGSTIPITIEIGGAYGQRHNFDLREIKLGSNDNEKKYLDIERMGCFDNNYAGVGINDNIWSDYLFKLKYPSTDYSNLDAECNISNLSFDLISFMTDYDIPISFEEMKPITLLNSLLSDIDIQVSSRNEPGNRQIAYFTMSLNNDLKLNISTEIYTDFEKMPFFWDAMVQNLKDSYDVDQKYLEDNIISAWEVILEDYFSDPEFTAEMTRAQKMMLYEVDYSLSWSSKFYREVSLLSKGIVDAGILGLKTYTVSKMSKYELQMLLENFGFDKQLQGLYLDLIYEYYSDSFEQVRIFANSPQGMSLRLQSKQGLDGDIFLEIEENPMLIFSILNNVKISIIANPSI